MALGGDTTEPHRPTEEEIERFRADAERRLAARGGPPVREFELTQPASSALDDLTFAVTCVADQRWAADFIQTIAGIVLAKHLTREQR